MEQNLKKALDLLNSGNFTCVVCKEDVVYTTTQRGVAPLLNWLDSKTDLKDFSFQNPKLKMFSHVRLLPGQELAWHEHHGECEHYYILRGTGIYNDNGEKIPVGPGDVTCTPNGTGHGMVNTGDVDLEFVALILFD